MTYEQKIEKEYDTYKIVCIPDCYGDGIVIDWKTGGTSGYEKQLQLYMWALGEEYRKGYIVGVKASITKGVMDGVWATKVMSFQRSDKANDWDYIFSDMANDIILNLKNFYKYLHGE